MYVNYWLCPSGQLFADWNQPYLTQDCNSKEKSIQKLTYTHIIIYLILIINIYFYFFKTAVSFCYGAKHINALHGLLNIISQVTTLNEFLHVQDRNQNGMNNMEPFYVFILLFLRFKTVSRQFRRMLKQCSAEKL